MIDGPSEGDWRARAGLVSFSLIAPCAPASPLFLLAILLPQALGKSPPLITAHPNKPLIGRHIAQLQ